MSRPTLKQQWDRWERTPWTQRVDCPESGLTDARPLSDDVPMLPSLGDAIGEELNFHDDD
jgi:hypothetical protein